MSTRKRKADEGDVVMAPQGGATQVAVAAAVKLENQLQMGPSPQERHQLLTAAVEQAGSLQELMHAAVAQNAYTALEAVLLMARDAHGSCASQAGTQAAAKSGASGPGGKELISSASDVLWQRTTCAICMEIMVAPFTGAPAHAAPAHSVNNSTQLAPRPPVQPRGLTAAA